MPSLSIENLASQLSLKDIQSLLKKKEQDAARANRLQTKKAKLLAEIEEIDAKLASFGGGAALGKKRGPKPGRKPGPKPGRKRGPKPGRKRSSRGGGPTYRDMIYAYLSDGDESQAKDIINAVVKQRFGSTPTASQAMAVRAVLSSDDNIKRVGRGVYTLKKRAAAAASSARKVAAPVKKKRRGRKKKGTAQVAKPSRCQLIYEYLERKGGSANLKKALEDVVGTSEWQEVRGVIMALGRDARFTRDGDTISIG